jgi:hypothetical protein
LTFSCCKVWHKTASFKLQLAKPSAQSFVASVFCPFLAFCTMLMVNDHNGCGFGYAVWFPKSC